jgi:hypothetical protein
VGSRAIRAATLALPRDTAGERITFRRRLVATLESNDRTPPAMRFDRRGVTSSVSAAFVSLPSSTEDRRRS